jgi:hypothetical protein
MERHGLSDDDGKPKVDAESVREIEISLAGLEDLVASAKPPPGMHPQDLYFAIENEQKIRVKAQAGIYGRRVILGRIRTRLGRYLAETEAAMDFGQVATGAFERVRRVVDARLAAIAPDALLKFQSAYGRANAGDPEAGSQALASCRRILLSLADALYPATGKRVRGADGRDRLMSPAKYRNRLWQYISDHVPPLNLPEQSESPGSA